MSLIHRIMRSAAHYEPGKTPVEYEKPKLHRIARVPTFEKHTRTIRTLGPVNKGRLSVKETCIKEHPTWGAPGDGGITTLRQRFRLNERKVISRTVEKVIMAKDGRTPRHPILTLVKDPKTGEQRVEHQVEAFPVQAPIRLKVGSPKWQYRQLKKLERRVGLVEVYKQMKEVA